MSEQPTNDLLSQFMSKRTPMPPDLSASTDLPPHAATVGQAQAAADAGLPLALADRLVGTTSEELSADAENLASLLAAPPPPLRFDSGLRGNPDPGIAGLPAGDVARATIVALNDGKAGLRPSAPYLPTPPRPRR